MAQSFGALTEDQWKAERDNLGFRRHGNYPGLTKLVFVKRFAARADHLQWNEDVADWLNDPDRPGGWDRFGFTMTYHPVEAEYYFFFTEWTTAFEFRFRWQ